jgi:hypothetical protein
LVDVGCHDDAGAPRLQRSARLKVHGNARQLQ